MKTQIENEKHNTTLIEVKIPGGLLMLTTAEYARGIGRGKNHRRIMAQRERERRITCKACISSCKANQWCNGKDFIPRGGAR